MSHTNNDANAYWEVDLGGRFRIDTISVWNREDCCADRLNNFRVLVSKKPFTSESLDIAARAKGVKEYRFDGTAGRTEYFNIARKGRYVRVQLVGSGHLQLAEVEVLGAPVMSLRNLSPQKTIDNSYTRVRVNNRGGYTSNINTFKDAKIRPNRQRIVGITPDGEGNYWLLRDDRLSPQTGKDSYVLIKVDANGNKLGDFLPIVDDNIVPSKQVLKGLAFDGIISTANRIEL